MKKRGFVTLFTAFLIVHMASCKKRPNLGSSSSAEKEIIFQELEAVDAPVIVSSSKISVNGFVIYDAKINRTDGEGNEYFVIAEADREFYCGHDKRVLSDLNLGGLPSLKKILMDGRVEVDDTSPIWLFFGGSKSVIFSQNKTCYVFSQDFGVLGGSLILVSKKDGEVAAVNYSKPVVDPSELVRLFILRLQ